MDIEEFFRHVKTRCDKLRVISGATNKVSFFTIDKDDVLHVFTIGAKERLGSEYMFVGTHDRNAAESILAATVEALGTTDSDKVTLGPNWEGFYPFTFQNTRWAVSPVDYDKVNCALSGILAAVYGTATPLRQLLLCDMAKKLPGEPGYRDTGFNQILYTE